MSKAIIAAISSGTIKEKIANLEAHKKAIEDKIAECQEAVEAHKRAKIAVPFAPKNGENYWFYTEDGDVFRTKNVEDIRGTTYIKLGNTFRTETEAMLAHEKRCAEAELLRMCDGVTTPIGEKFYFPALAGKDNTTAWVTNFGWLVSSSPYRFASKDSCIAAIDKMGDRKLRLVFNIPVED